MTGCALGRSPVRWMILPAVLCVVCGLADPCLQSAVHVAAAQSFPPSSKIGTIHRGADGRLTVDQPPPRSDELDGSRGPASSPVQVPPAPPVPAGAPLSRQRIVTWRDRRGAGERYCRMGRCDLSGFRMGARTEAG
jgi:hypothetical protein